jgi:uncharacterized protein (TIGR02246 family)
MPEPAAAVAAATALYRRLIEAWNDHDADAMGAALLEDSLVIGFDGSQMIGRAQVVGELASVFADHEVARYVTKVRSVTPLGADVAVLQAVAGMVPPGAAEIMPERNSVQTVVSHRTGGEWLVALFQTTPAQFHGRPELSEALTGELNQELRTSAPLR